MVYVFAQARDVPVDIRQLAGLVVKNYVVLADKFCSLDEGVQTLVKRSIIAAISDSDPSVRSTATNLLGGMSRQLPVDAWSDVVGTIIAGLNTSGGSADCMSGSLMALRRLSEDAGEKMAVDCGRFPLVAAVPVLFSACRSSEVSHRRLALDALISLLFVIFDPPPLPLSAGPAPSLTCFVPEYLSTVSFLAADPDPVVRTAVCQAIVLVMTSHADTLTTSLDQICSFMLAATGDVNSNVAIEAAEFWTALADVASSESISPRSDHSMIRYLLRCIPVLLSRMLLTAEQVEADRAQLEAEIAGQKEVHFGQAGGNSIYHHRSKDISGKKGGKRTNDDDGATGKYILLPFVLCVFRCRICVYM